MNNKLWEKIQKFDFDNPPSEYGFSTRLAFENFWTKDFTTQALLEYKKFMYLAATSDFMVSPSEIVDTVWHQHLIFTQSYSEFCLLLGKQIQHIPSTHNKEDFNKFEQAKERTKKQYSENFGDQPSAFWENNGIFESLHLVKARFKIRTVLVIGIIAFIILIIPAYSLLQPVYLSIKNPHFIILFLSLCCITFLGLELLNRYYLNNIIKAIAADSFIYNLMPYELIYLKTQKLTSVINGFVNELIENKNIKVNLDNTIEVKKVTVPKSKLASKEIIDQKKLVR